METEPTVDPRLVFNFGFLLLEFDAQVCSHLIFVKRHFNSFVCIKSKSKQRSRLDITGGFR